MSELLSKTPVGHLAWIRTDRDLPDSWVWLKKPILKKADYPEVYAIIGDAYGEDEDTFAVTPLDTTEKDGLRLVIKVREG